ncbi:MAG: hypothetical protein E6536_00225 [Enterococcus faecalis]|nr:hypothetical protein [Enterococcus faecalis]
MNLFSIISFLVIVICVWIFAYSRSRSVDTSGSEGFFMGGRSLTALPIAGTIIMTNLSTDGLGSNCCNCNCRIGSHFFTKIF